MENEIQQQPYPQAPYPSVQGTGREVTVHQPDAFDLGQNDAYGRPAQQQTITEVITNPDRIFQSLDVTERQLENILSAIAGIGAGVGSGLSTKHFSKTFGVEFAAALGGAIGGLLGGYTGKKLVGNRRRVIQRTTRMIE